MKHIENDVYNYIKDNNLMVLYKVTMKYRGNDQIPIGILIEPQYIQGTRTTEQVIIDNGFKFCKKCK